LLCDLAVLLVWNLDSLPYAAWSIVATMIDAALLLMLAGEHRWAWHLLWLLWLGGGVSSVGTGFEFGWRDLLGYASLAVQAILLFTSLRAMSHTRPSPDAPTAGAEIGPARQAAKWVRSG
jgi:hypothetical protein